MSDLAPLHDLLSEMVQAYSQKKPSTAHPHPRPKSARIFIPCSTACVKRPKTQRIRHLHQRRLSPAIKVGGTLTPMPHKALTGADTAAIAESTMNPDQLEAFNRDWEINYSVQSRSNTRYRVNAYHEQGRVGMVLRRVSQDIPRNEDPRFTRKAPRACTRTARPADPRRPERFG